MEPIIAKWTSLEKDGTGKYRPMVKLPDGRHMSQARLMMMNFLHTNNIPKKFHVHHKNEICDDDRLDNLEILSSDYHNFIHHPRDSSRFGVSCSDDPKLYRHLYSKEYRATHVDTRKDDPEWVERRNAHTRKYAANKKATDPNWPEHRRILMNNYYNSHKDDPEFREKRNTYNRMARLKKKMEATNEI